MCITLLIIIRTPFVNNNKVPVFFDKDQVAGKLSIRLVDNQQSKE